MGKIASVIGSIVAAILGAVFDALRGKRLDRDRIDTHERAATAEASAETQQVIADTADERSKIETPDDPDELAKSLRNRESQIK